MKKSQSNTTLYVSHKIILELFLVYCRIKYMLYVLLPSDARGVFSS